MIEIRFAGTVGQDLQDLGIGISWVEVIQNAGQPVVVALSGKGGGLVSLSFDADGQALVADTQYLSSGLWAASAGLALIATSTDIFATVAHDGSQNLVGYSILGDQIGALSSLSGPGIAGGVGTYYQEIAGFLFSADTSGTLRCFRSDGARSFIASSVTVDTGTSFHAVPGAMGQIEVQGRVYLLTSCLQDVGISAYEVDQATGAIRHASSMGVANGLGMFSTPVSIETATLSGRGYIVVASAADIGTGAALSVLEITADGKMGVTDHILDSHATRFGRAISLEVVEHKGWVYVIAQGGEQGVSLFTLMPGGRLLHLKSFVGTATIDLAGQSGLAAVMTGDQLQLLISTYAATGFRQFNVDLADQGSIQEAGVNGTALNGGAGRDMIVGGAGPDTLNGGAGDDIIRDGGGQDRLIGGGGTDTFVVVQDGALDVIADFDVTQDRIDLSFVPMLYSAEYVSFSSRSWGGVLTYRGEDLELRSVHIQPLDSAQVMSALAWGADRPPLVLRQEQEGSGGDDTLRGGDGSDLIHAGSGNDIVVGFAGDDELYGEDGADKIYAGVHNDTVHGGNGNDLIFLGDGEDHAFAGEGDDTVDGGNGRDLVYLNQGNDRFIDNAEGGEFGQDTVFAGYGDDIIEGGDGDDLFHGQWGSDLIYGGLGDDLIYGDDHYDTIQGGAGNDTVDGGNGRDLVYLNEGNDLYVDNTQSGELGKDTVFGGYGEDTIQGGHGDDVFHGQWGSDLIYGGLGNDLIYGGDHYDTIHGGAGNDTVDGGNGRDLVYLNEGNDLYVDNAQGGYRGRDTVFGGTGADTIRGGDGDDLFHGQWGSDLIYGGLGDDLIYGDDHYDTIQGGAGNDTVDGGNGRDLVYLNEGNDLYVDNTQSGELGKDTVFGGYGEDTIQGGHGDDVFHGQWGSDLIYGGLGDDLIYGGDHYDTIHGGEGNDTVDGGNGRDLVYLNQGDDIYIDNDQGGVLGNDTVFGGSGDDTIDGGDGADRFDGQWGNDSISAGLGNDTVYGGDQFDFIDAGDGDDLVYGGNGRDTILLGAGNDVYVDTAQAGVLGQDTITGGADADRFEFQAVMSADVIVNFEVGVDDLQLTQSLWGGGLRETEVVSTYASVTAEGVLFDFGEGQSILLQGLNSTVGLAGDILLG